MLMRRFLLAAALAVLAVPAFAQAPFYASGQVGAVGNIVPAQSQSGASLKVVLPNVGTRNGPITPLGYQQITSLSSATALTVPTGATIAYVTVETQGVRWRDDGTSPTASIGNPVAAGAQLVYSGNLSAIKFIQQAASATIDVAYYQ